jgi:hypothetical protein
VASNHRRTHRGSGWALAHPKPDPPGTPPVSPLVQGCFNFSPIFQLLQLHNFSPYSRKIPYFSCLVPIPNFLAPWRLKNWSVVCQTAQTPVAGLRRHAPTPPTPDDRPQAPVAAAGLSTKRQLLLAGVLAGRADFLASWRVAACCW